MGKIDLAFIGIYLVAMLAIGLYANRKDKGTENYYVGGRRQGALSIMCLWVSCWIGGASVIGTSTKGYDMGITAVWYVGMTAVGCMLFSLLLSKKVKLIGDKLQHITYPEFIESRYDGRARLVATVCTLFGMIGVTASQLVAAGEILNTLTNLGLGTSFIIASVVLIAYTSVGGFMAVVYTDWAQVALLVLGIVIGVPFAARATGGIGAVTALPESYFDLGAWGWPTIIAFAVSTVLSFFTTMDSYTRCLSAKSPAVARRGGVYAALLIIPLAFCSTYEGMATKLLIPELPQGTNAMTNLILLTFPSGIKGIVIVGILAAIMSSGDVAIITGSANITRDIYQRYINPDASEKTVSRLGMLASVCIGLVSALIAWFMQDIMNILFITLTILSAGLFFPTFMGFVWKRGNATAAFLSILIATVTVIGWYICQSLGLGGIFDIDCVWPGLLASGVIYFVVSLLGKQSDSERARIEEFLSLGKEV